MADKVKLTKAERHLAALERCAGRMLRDGNRAYREWLEHNYPGTITPLGLTLIGGGE